VTREIVETLKKVLKARGMTYAELAQRRDLPQDEGVGDLRVAADQVGNARRHASTA